MATFDPGKPTRRFPKRKVPDDLLFTSVTGAARREYMDVALRSIRENEKRRLEDNGLLGRLAKWFRK